MTDIDEKLQKLHNEFLVRKSNNFILESFAGQMISYIREVITTSNFLDAMHAGSTSISNIINRPIITINIAVKSVNRIRQFFEQFSTEYASKLR